MDFKKTVKQSRKYFPCWARQPAEKGPVEGEKGMAVAPEKYLEAGMHPENTSVVGHKGQYRACRVAASLRNGVFLGRCVFHPKLCGNLLCEKGGSLAYLWEWVSMKTENMYLSTLLEITSAFPVLDSWTIWKIFVLTIFFLFLFESFIGRLNFQILKSIFFLWFIIVSRVLCLSVCCLKHFFKLTSPNCFIIYEKLGLNREYFSLLMKE